MSARIQDNDHPWMCICRGSGTVEDGPAGATYSVPCPGPPLRVMQHGRTYIHEHSVRQAHVPREDAEALARAVSASLTHGEKSPLEAALSVFLSKHPWSDL